MHTCHFKVAIKMKELDDNFILILHISFDVKTNGENTPPSILLFSVSKDYRDQSSLNTGLVQDLIFTGNLYIYDHEL